MALKNIPYQQLSGDAQLALQQFDTRFTAAFTAAKVEQWAMLGGLYIPSNMVQTRVPAPVFAAVFKKLLGEQAWRSLGERSITVVPQDWQDGVEELLRVVEAPDFTGWGEQPEAMATAAAQVPNAAVAAALEGGTAAPVCIDGGFFFREQHPFDVTNTAGDDYDNAFYSVTINADLLGTIGSRFRKIKEPSGTAPLGLRFTHVFAPPALEYKFRTLLEQGWIVQTQDAGDTFGPVDNILKGGAKLVICDELTSDTAFYPCALNKPGMKPWIYTGREAPEVIIFGPDSEFCKEHRKVRYGAILTGEAGLAMPHCIARYDTAAA